MTMAAFGICSAPAHMLININKTPVRPEQCVAISLSLALAPTPAPRLASAPAIPCAWCASDV